MKIILYSIYFFTFTLYTTQAFAYLDPGTGSVILQMIVGLVAAIYAFLIFYYNKFKSFIKKLFSKNKPKDI